MKLSKMQTAFIAAIAACKLDMDREYLVTHDDNGNPLTCDLFGAYLIASKTVPDSVPEGMKDDGIRVYGGLVDACPARLVTALCLRDFDGAVEPPMIVGKKKYATLIDANVDGVSFADIAKYIAANTGAVFVTPDERKQLDAELTLSKKVTGPTGPDDVIEGIGVPKVTSFAAAKEKCDAKPKAPARKKVVSKAKAPARKKAVSKSPAKPKIPLRKQDGTKAPTLKEKAAAKVKAKLDNSKPAEEMPSSLKAFVS